MCGQGCSSKIWPNLATSGNDTDFYVADDSHFHAFDLQSLTWGILRPAENDLPAAYQDLPESWRNSFEAREVMTRTNRYLQQGRNSARKLPCNNGDALVNNIPAKYSVC